MSKKGPLNELSFQFRPSPSTNDHEVLVIVDGRSALGKGCMGVDPPEFFAQLSNPDASRLLIGRCTCGVVGCGDYVVAVERDRNQVTWRGDAVFRFDRTRYEEVVRAAASDFSWEDQNRRAERLAMDVLRGSRTKGFTFQWASARITPKVMALSFIKDGEQKMLEFAWDGATDESAIRGAEQLRRRLDGR